MTLVGNAPWLLKLHVKMTTERKAQLNRIRTFLKLENTRHYIDKRGRHKCVHAWAIYTGLLKTKVLSIKHVAWSYLVRLVEKIWSGHKYIRVVLDWKLGSKNTCGHIDAGIKFPPSLIQNCVMAYLNMTLNKTPLHPFPLWSMLCFWLRLGSWFKNRSMKLDQRWCLKKRCSLKMSHRLMEVIVG